MAELDSPGYTEARLPRYVHALWFCGSAFFLRVLAQLIQEMRPVGWLPPVTAWQGSRLGYGWLLAVQGPILVIMLRTILRHRRGRVVASPALGTWLVASGTLYFLAMAARLAVGLLGLTLIAWFNKPLPALFHLVLATFILILGAYHRGWLGHD